MVPDALDEPGEAFPLLCAGELPLLGDEPAGDVELVAGAVGLLAAEVTGVAFGVADVLACAVGLPQMVPGLDTKPAQIGERAATLTFQKCEDCILQDDVH